MFRKVDLSDDGTETEDDHMEIFYENAKESSEE